MSSGESLFNIEFFPDTLIKICFKSFKAIKVIKLVIKYMYDFKYKNVIITF